MTESIIFLIIGIVIGIIFFLAIREIVCWYFKINNRLFILEDIKNSLINIEKANEKILKNTLDTSDSNPIKKSYRNKKSDEQKFYDNISKIYKNTKMKLSSVKELEILDLYIKMEYSELLEIERNIKNISDEEKIIISVLREEINKYT